MYYIVKSVKDSACRVPSDWNKKKFFSKGKIIKLYDNNKLVGNCLIKYNWIFNFVIEPNSRRQGYGTILLYCAEKEISKKYNKSLLIPSDNEDGIVEFYSKNGYIHKISKSDPLYEDENKDCWIMLKRLNNENTIF